MNTETMRLVIQGYLYQNRDQHPSTVLAIPFTLSEWNALLKELASNT